MLIPITSGFTVPAGGYTFVNAEAEAIVDEFDVPPDDTRKELIDDTVGALKAAGIWANLDILYVMAAHDAQAGNINWVAPASFTLTPQNSPTFTADRGRTGNGSDAYMETGWSPANDGVNFAQDDASLFVWNLSNRGNAEVSVCGAFGESTSDIGIIPMLSDLVLLRLNDQPATGAFAATASNGLFHADRQSSTARTGYRNATSIGSYGSENSGALIVATLPILCNKNNGTPGAFSSDQVAIMGAGASLNAEKDDLHTILGSYLTAVGAI